MYEVVFVVMDSSHEITDGRKLRLLEWLTTPEDLRAKWGWPTSQGKLADELGVSAKTIRNWKVDPAFRAVWEKEAKDFVGDPERVQMLIEDIYKGARDLNETLASRVRAAELFFKVTDSIAPPKVDQAKREASELSDSELQALIAQAAQQELQGRNAS